MAILSGYDAEIKALGSTSGVTSHYRSDHRVAFMGGRGGRDEEIAYLNSQATPNRGSYLHDAWSVYLAEGWGMIFSRVDHAKRRHFEENSGF